MDSNNKKRQKMDFSSFTCSPDTIMLNAGQSSDSNIDLGATLPPNLYFTLCDDISNESHDFLTTNRCEAVPEIKEELKQDISNTNPSLEYRIAQMPKSLPISNESSTLSAHNLRVVALDGTRCRTQSIPVDTSLLSAATTVQLPSGCEIYLVKEYVDSDTSEILLTEDCCEEPPLPVERLTLPQGVTIRRNPTQTILKSGSVSILPKTSSIKTEPDPSQSQFIGGSIITSKIENNTLKLTAGTVASNYKKRDERRRATHNEVERRRRDKINSWIFKLKEMLPTDASSGGLATSESKEDHVRNSVSGTTTSLPTSNMSNAIADGFEKSHRFQRGSSSNCRSPPNDSKSQILIKACEYIRAMQDELKSLRECLMENERLRSSNLRLQNELEKLKNSEQRPIDNDPQQELSNDTINNNNDCGCPSEDFTLELCTNGISHLDDVTSSTIFIPNPASETSIALIKGRNKTKTAPYTKRELIITDYVD